MKKKKTSKTNTKAKYTHWKKDSIFNNRAGQTGYSHVEECRRMQTDPYLLHCTKLKSKWIKDLNIKPDILNLIEEKVGNNLEHFGTCSWRQLHEQNTDT